MKKTRQIIKYNLSLIRFNWWINPTEKRFKIINCLCEMCHQNRQSRPGATPSIYDGWCDECFSELPLWLKLNRTTPEELANLKKKQEDAARDRRLKREEKANILAAKTKKKAKLTGFENVEKEEETGEEKEVDSLVVADSNIEEQRQSLELIFNYSDDD